MDEFLGWCVDLSVKYFGLLADLEIVSGVSVLTFLVALFVLGAIINAFLLRSR